MTDKRVRISIASLVILLVFAGLLHFVPISISFGQRQAVDLDPRNMSLQPGLYHVEVKKPMRLPDEMETVPCTKNNYDEGFKHGGAPKYNPKGNPCGGGMKTLLLNNGDMEYVCTICQKKWLQSSDSSQIRGKP